MKLPENFDLDHKAATLLEKLRELAIEHQVVCQQAPHIWDGETNEDAITARNACNGKLNNRSGRTIPPCPIRSLCLETAIATQSHFGVWGGLTAQERRNLRRKH